MSKVPALSSNERRLVRRYLVWCYKTTKEELDRVDRYFTQSLVDDYLIERLKKLPAYKSADPDFLKAVEDFVAYAGEKKARAGDKKFADLSAQTLRPDYQYLQARLEAIEEAITHFLGEKEREEIVALYEQEMTERILKAREHT